MSSKMIYLYVDDSRVSRMKIRQLVQQARPDWELIEATSGEEAIAKTAGSCPDLISIDINMPGMNGMEAVGELRKNCPNARFVLLSSNIQEEMHRQARDLGVGFVEKPITESCIAKVLAYFE
ncbi:MAG: response regulator [Sterolibacterium sp.]